MQIKGRWEDNGNETDKERNLREEIKAESKIGALKREDRTMKKRRKRGRKHKNTRSTREKVFKYFQGEEKRR